MSRRSFTLIEIVVATTVLAGLSIAILSATLPLQKASTDSALNSSIDTSARKVFDQLRRELRQSGAADTTDQVTQPPTPIAAKTTGAVLEFKMRTSLGDDPVADWTAAIRYELQPGSPATFKGVAGSVARWELVRRVGGANVVLAHDVVSVTFTRDPGDASILVDLELMRADPNWTGTTPPPPFRRRYRERIAHRN